MNLFISISNSQFSIFQEMVKLKDQSESTLEINANNNIVNNVKIYLISIFWEN